MPNFTFKISNNLPVFGIILAAVLGSFGCMAPISLAAGIQVSPPRLEISARGGQRATAKLVVANPTADVQIFTVSADNFEDAVSAMPESFTLDAGGRREITITVDSGKLPSRDAALATNISVVGKPLADTRVRVGTGIKIPIAIATTQPKGSRLMLTVIPAAIFSTAGALLYWLLKKRKKKIDSTLI